jgi:RNA polymerase sigma factor (sigma-70 family)
MTDPATIERTLKALAPQVLGVVVRRYRRFDLAEDAVQEALVAAASQWPVEGVPTDPRAWLVRVARRRMVDAFRSDDARRRREQAPEVLGFLGAEGPQAAGEDDSLLLLFMCCHPDLTPSAAIPLTLRAVGGLTTAEIARAFLVSEATMAQRISRAKQKLRASGADFVIPAPENQPERLRSVLHVLYLIFNEGYTSSAGARLGREELAAEAIRLTREVHARRPAEGAVTGLLALMLLTEARRPARTGPAGELIALSDQDRSRWDRALIAEGVALAVQAMAGGAGDYQLQAAIAALHDEAPTAAATDWVQILWLYGALERLTGNPMVALNRAVAVAMVQGPEAGLALLPGLDIPLAGHYRLEAVRAHLLEEAGDVDAAVAAYRSAARRTLSQPEARYLAARASALAAKRMAD